uniref:Fungal-type protein kinase domain-containing protein n=1 Tax=Ganoderma boninense TaxID=34458 RepID=A0A5K1JWR1_9APHY|nr:Uncharacterized protein [Ganoderma boninense]
MVGRDSPPTTPTASHGELVGNAATINPEPAESQCSEFSQSQYSELEESSQATQESQPRGLRKTGTGGGAWNAPVAHVMMTETSGQTYGFGDQRDSVRYGRLANEARRWVLGPMPPVKFLEEFLNPQGRMWKEHREKMPEPREAFNEVPKREGSEKKIYEPLAKAINRGRCPGFTVCITSEAADASGPLPGLTGSSKPDLSCFANEHVDLVDDYTAPTSRQTNPAPTANTSTPKSKRKLDSTCELQGPPGSSELVPMKRAHMGYAALVIEVKGSSSDDSFRDPKSGDDRAKFHFVTQSTDIEALKRLGQQVSYATELCKRQHRHFCFTISICSHYARFIRWDRAGAIVSERFSVLDQPELLCDFLWRFAWASLAERGYDLTVEPATDQQAMVFKLAIEAHVKRQSMSGSEGSRHYAAEQPAGHYLLVSRPIAVPLSVAGRCTRAYWAVDSRTERVWLLKDTWRYDVPGEDPIEHDEDILNSVVRDDQLPESDILMIEYNHEDVQTTLTQNFLGHSWVCRAKRTLDEMKKFIIKRTHYRLVLNVAGYPLLRFHNSNELLYATYDAFGALKAAFEQRRRLHRDVTPGNIILYKDSERGSGSTSAATRPSMYRTGYVIDWELSRRCERQDSYIGDDGESFPVSSGGRPRHTFGDDMESMIYVVLYCALLWLPLKTLEPWVVQRSLEFFDDFTLWEDGVSRGGLLKNVNLRDRSYTSKLHWTTPTIEKWLSEALGRRRPPNSKAVTEKGITIMKGFYTWWGNLLEECQDLKPAKRSDNANVEDLKEVFKARRPAATMDNVAYQSTISAASSLSNRTVNKRPRGDDGVLLPKDPEAGPSSKRLHVSGTNNGPSGGYLPPMSWRSTKDTSIDTTVASTSWSSSHTSSALREFVEMDHGAEEDSTYTAFESDAESGEEEGSSAELLEAEAEAEGRSELQNSAVKGKGRARGVQGWE